MCPGDSVSITCTHDNSAGEQTQWVITGTVECEVIVSHVTRADAVCGPFTISMISNNNGPTVNSTAVSSDTSAINGITVQCRDSGLSSSAEVGSLNVSVFGKVRCKVVHVYHCCHILN